MKIFVWKIREWLKRQKEQEYKPDSKNEKVLLLQQQAKLCVAGKHAFENVKLYNIEKDFHYKCKECPYCGELLIPLNNGEWAVYEELTEESQDIIDTCVSEKEYEHIQMVSKITKHIDIGGAT